MEHAISPEVAALLIKRFGDKKSCPHGVPMRCIATLRPATTVDVLKREWAETMTLRVNGKAVHLGKPGSSRIWVKKHS